MDKPCPKCRKPMLAYMSQSVELDRCESCLGLWFDPDELAKVIGDDPPNFKQVPHSPGDGGICPICSVNLEEREAKSLSTVVLVDVCPKCTGLFLDFGELEDFKAQTRRGRHVMDREEKSPSYDGLIISVSHSGRAMFAYMTGLPLETENVLSRIPIILYGLLVVIAGVWFGQVFGLGLEQSWSAYGMVPSDIVQGRNTHTLLTAMFLHGGWVHVLSNLYYFWLFGDNVEDRLGPVWFAIWYFLWGVAAWGATLLISADSAVPHVGASGAIAGVMGAYAVFFPKARIMSGIGFWRVILLPSWVYLGFWMALQFFGALQLGESGIAWSAHVGGFIVGAATAVVYRRFHSAPNEGPPGAG